MATFMMTLMHGDRGGEGTYMFEGPDDLMRHSPVTVLKAAMAHLDAHAGLGHIDFEINAALKNSEKSVVTALGALVFHGEDFQPFVCFIAPS